MPKVTKAEPDLSMNWVQYPDGSYGVEIYLTGFSSKAEAEAAMDHVQRQLCANEIPTH